MLSCRDVFDTLRERGVSLFAGVPDSLLKDFCAYVTDHAEESAHFITANEGSAIGLATGHHLASDELALVYMQNSGLGNAVNPLISLADHEVYSVPMLLLIGWRGEPGRHDEPQHVKQGKITLSLLETMGIPFEVLPDTFEGAKASMTHAVDVARRDSIPYALVVRKGTFHPYRLQKQVLNPYSLTREEVVQHLVDRLPSSAVIVSTTGKVSRELFEYRVRLGHEPGRDFLTVGSMGHASLIALGVARTRPERLVYCLDGDGAVIMHMGSLTTIGGRPYRNFKHIVINNGAHESVGSQPTAGFGIDLPAIALACGYRFAARSEALEELSAKIDAVTGAEGPALLEIRTNRKARSDLGRPTTSPIENKSAFIRHLRS